MSSPKIIKVAVVDDEAPILKVIEKYLQRNESLNVETFDNPLVAYEKILNSTYDIVLCDIMMPQMDGIELYKKVKEALPNQKFIIMTAHSTEERMITCDSLEVNDYITKPFISLKDVENKIFDVLEEK